MRQEFIKSLNRIYGIILLTLGIFLFYSFFTYIISIFNQNEKVSIHTIPGRFLFLSFNAAGVYLPFFLTNIGINLVRNNFSFRNFIFFSLWVFPMFTLGIVFRLMFSKTYDQSIITHNLINSLSLEGAVILFMIISLILIISIMQMPTFLENLDLKSFLPYKDESLNQSMNQQTQDTDEVINDDLSELEKKRKDSYISKFIDEKINNKTQDNTDDFTVFFTTSNSEFPAKENILKLKEKPLETFELINLNDTKSKIYQKKFGDVMLEDEDKEDEKEIFVIEKKQNEGEGFSFTDIKVEKQKAPNPPEFVVENKFNKKEQNLDNFQDIEKHSKIIQKKDTFVTDYQQKKEDKKVEIVENIVLENQDNKGSNYKVQDFLDYVFYKVFKQTPLSLKEDGANKIKAIENSKKIVSVLKDFNIDVKITSYFIGPIVTVFELVPISVVKLTKIMGLIDNISLSIGTSNVRMFAPIPGKDVIGIEVPNVDRKKIYLSSIIKRNFNLNHKLPFILGVNIMGEDHILDISQAPHILIAGATGSGKSVCLNVLIASLVFYKTPQELKLVIIDPKMVEFNLFSSLPHLLSAPVSDPQTALNVIAWLVVEMERRYSLLKSKSVKNIINYNQLKDIEKLPYIVVIIDEYADLLSDKNKKEIESKILKLANMSRAIGIHLVIATQRPSANVITGVIKANIPTKVSFSVANAVDSRVILDSGGAEKLLGSGDMLVSCYDSGGILIRSQGAYIDEQEIVNLVDYCQVYKDEKKNNHNFNETKFSSNSSKYDNINIDDIKIGDKEKKILEELEKNGMLMPSELSKKFSLTYDKALKLYNYIEMNK